MIKKFNTTFTFQEHLIALIRDELAIEAIKDDGIYSTFKFDNDWLPTMKLTKITLRYCKFDGDGCSWMPIKKNIFYKTCPELGDARYLYIAAETMKNVTDRIKMDMVKNDNAIWSTIKVQPCYDHFDVSYEKAYVDKPMTAQELEIENTKRTSRSVQEACDYATKCLGFTDAETLRRISEKFSYVSHNKEEKEKTDMNVTLLVVPEGMNKDFVNKVKANFQSNNSQRLFVASTDIDYSCEHEPIKTKYDLFENWIKTGKVDVVYFMLGFEKDPDVRAFEAFVRGITEAEVPGKIDVRVVYQKDDIKNDIQHLRNAYFDEADAKEDLERAGYRVVREAKVMTEVYSLNNTGLDIILYSKGKIDASDELVINDIMETAFAEEVKPAKKGGKK